jgi:nucleoside-diphosphate-sugar epimerase
MALVILRMATVFGECDPGNVGRLVRAIDGRRFIWIGRGENNKSLIHREDAARACLLALQAATPGAATFNVASVVTTMRTIVQTIAANLGRTVPRWHVPAQPLLGAARLLVSMRVGGSRANGLVLALNTWLANEVFDGTAFRQWCGFSPSVSLEVGLHRQVKWYQAVRGGS